MADDDLRIRIEVEEEEHAAGFLERLTGDLDPEARELARDLESHRLAVSRDGDTVFVYAATRAAAEQAHPSSRPSSARTGIEARTSQVEHWLDEEDRWDDEPPGETWEEEELDRGFAPWEVRVECPSREEADALADAARNRGLQAGAALPVPDRRHREPGGRGRPGNPAARRGRGRRRGRLGDDSGQSLCRFRRSRRVTTLTIAADGVSFGLRRSSRGITRAPRIS